MWVRVTSVPFGLVRAYGQRDRSYDGLMNETGRWNWFQACLDGGGDALRRTKTPSARRACALGGRNLGKQTSFPVHWRSFRGLVGAVRRRSHAARALKKCRYSGYDVQGHVHGRSFPCLGARSSKPRWPGQRFTQPQTAAPSMCWLFTSTAPFGFLSAMDYQPRIGAQALSQRRPRQCELGTWPWRFAATTRRDRNSGHRDELGRNRLGPRNPRELCGCSGAKCRRASDSRLRAGPPRRNDHIERN